MGASLTFLDEANTDVTTECGDWGPLSYSVSGMQGWRRSMEDDHIAHWDNNKRVGIFGVFDGHGGKGASKFVAKKIIKTMLNTEAYKNNDYARALHEAFMEVDKEMATPEGSEEIMKLHNDGLKEDQQKILLKPSQLPEVLQQMLGVQGVTEEDDDEEEEDISDAAADDDDESYQNANDDIEMNDALGDRIKDDQPLSDPDNDHDDAADASTAPHTAESSPTNTPLEGDYEEVEDEIDLETLHQEKHDEVSSDTQQDGNQQSQQESSVLLIPNNIGDIIKLNDDGLLEIPENEFWKMLGRQITADAQGCTAVVCALILGDGSTPPKLICANTGDSRCILARGNKAYALSEDHKPSQEIEMERIVAAGGQVEECMGQYRVQGDLNLSRALGDHRYKQNTALAPECQIISPMPDLRIRQLSKDDTHIILGCDGIWEIHSNQSAVDYVLSHEKAALRLIHNRSHNGVGQWKPDKGKKRKGSPVRAASQRVTAAPEVRSFKQPRLNDVTLHPGSEGSDSAFSLAALTGAACQATVCPELHFENPNFEGNGCDNLTFMIIKIPDEIRKALPAANPEETPEPGTPTIYGQRPPRKRNLNTNEEDEVKDTMTTNLTERNAKRLKLANTETVKSG